MTAKEDPRQRRTRQHLQAALLQLLAEKPFREISVVEICERAMVHRTTFYAHFEDKNELFRYVLNDLMRTGTQMRWAVSSQEGVRAGVMAELRQALEFFKAHRSVYLSGLAGGGMEVRIVEDAIAEGIRALVLEESAIGDRPYMSEVAGQFYAGGLAALVRWWLENDTPVSEDELLALLDRLLPEELKKA